MADWENAPVVAAGPPPGLPVPAWERAPVIEPQTDTSRVGTFMRGNLAPHVPAPEKVTGFLDALQAGLQVSVSGLIARGEAPSKEVSPDAPFYSRIGGGAATMVGDVPAMIGGAMLGGAAGIETGPGAGLTAMAGAFALPAGLRATLMDAYSKGEFQSFGDFWERSSGIIWDTAKGWLTGAATALSGGAARAALPAAAPAAIAVAAPTAAEVAAMVTVGSALEGRAPTAQEFVDAAIVLGGMKGATAVAARLRATYAATGKTPAEVIADASRDPSIKEDLIGKPQEAAQGSIGETVTKAAAATVDAAGLPMRPVAGPITPNLPEAKAGEIPLATERQLPRAYLPLAEAETARAIIPGVKAAAVAESPFAIELPQVKGEPAKPTHVNYNLINTAEDTKLALARLSEVYRDEIQAQRRGAVSWEQTSAETAKLLSDTLGGADLSLVMPREPGTAAGAAELLARKQMTVGAAEAMMGARDALLAKGENASPADKLVFLQAIERTSMIQSEFLGARAEAGRALNILKSTKLEAERVQQIQSVIDMYGGDPMKLAKMMGEIDNAAGALKFAKDAMKATTWEKVVEAWKAGILSGPVTHMANLIGNSTFMAMRPVIDAVAVAFGPLSRAADRVVAIEPAARVWGDLQGTVDGLKLAGAVFRSGEQPGKAEQFRPAISGVKGDVIRLPFRLLSAADAMFTTMNERGEAYSLAARQATIEGLHPLSREFLQRVVSISQSPTAEMAKQIESAGTRFTFNTELGETGQAVQNLVRKGHLQLIVPFVRTPANIAKELIRMTPLAPAIKDWRAAIGKGGAEQAKAMAEVAVGSAIMGLIASWAFDGSITGQGSPDPGKRRVMLASGWQPYSLKIGDTWYSYQRLQPIGTLIGMAADIAEIWDHLTDEEADKVPKMLSVAFANAITNQTFLQGITNIVQAMTEPQRFGAKFSQNLVSSFVPNIVGQTTSMSDPVAREVNSVIDAIRAKIPGQREQLLPKRDVFGEPVQNIERLAGVLPIPKRTESDDKVRAEAARIGFSAADAPKKTHIGKGTGKLGDVELTPEERNKFADVGGHFAYQVLSGIVNAPGYDQIPDLVKRQIFSKVFAASHKLAAVQAMPLDKRIAYIQSISEKVAAELTPELAQ